MWGPWQLSVGRIHLALYLAHIHQWPNPLLWFQLVGKGFQYFGLLDRDLLLEEYYVFYRDSCFEAGSVLSATAAVETTIEQTKQSNRATMIVLAVLSLGNCKKWHNPGGFAGLALGLQGSLDIAKDSFSNIDLNHHVIN